MSDFIDRTDETETVQLLDENGDPQSFEHLMTLNYEDDNYLVLHPLEQGFPEDEVVILRVDADEDGGEVYTLVEDMEQANRVFMEFLAILETDEDGEEGN